MSRAEEAVEWRASYPPRARREAGARQGGGEHGDAAREHGIGGVRLCCYRESMIFSQKAP